MLSFRFCSSRKSHAKRNWSYRWIHLETLNAKGELSLTQLKKTVGCKTPVFNWAIGWVAREDKIVIICEGRTFCVGLKGTEATAGAT
jgi:HSP20 family molecular chaperone IbpA